MRFFTRGFAASVMAACCLVDAHAATICVQNKHTGQLEPLGGGGSAPDCSLGSQEREKIREQFEINP